MVRNLSNARDVGRLPWNLIVGLARWNRQRARRLWDNLSRTLTAVLTLVLACPTLSPSVESPTMTTMKKKERKFEQQIEQETRFE
mmetsp:Transcript_36236/g.54088  ORF Transcript_36236/g.54088 Transcript_36236/m.54088 type:complete len:85 (+) Transcript_36236:501-755(+)